MEKRKFEKEGKKHHKLDFHLHNIFGDPQGVYKI